MRTVYIAGKIGNTDADVERARPKFMAAEAALIAAGYEVWNPIRLSGKYDRRSAYMRRGLTALLECDAIYMLSGWEASPGAQTEHRVAMDCDIEIMYEPVRSEGV